MSQLTQVVLLVPIFLTIEFSRAALWAARAAHDPDHDGGLLRALLAHVVAILGMVPSPIWTVVECTACIAWVPVRGVLWTWGIGRGSLKKRYPIAVTRWYTHTRARRAETLRRRRWDRIPSKTRHLEAVLE